MAYSFLTSTSGQGPLTSNVSLPSFNSTGAVLLVATMNSLWSGGAYNNTPTDNYGNTWISITFTANSSGVTSESNMWFTVGVQSTDGNGNTYYSNGLQTGSAHVVTFSSAGATYDAQFQVLAFSGNVPNLNVSFPTTLTTINASFNSNTSNTTTTGTMSVTTSATGGLDIVSVANPGASSLPTFTGGTGAGAAANWTKLQLTGTSGTYPNSSVAYLALGAGVSASIALVATWTTSGAATWVATSFNPGINNNYYLNFAETAFSIVETFNIAGIPTSYWHLSPNWNNASISGNLLSNVFGHTTGNTSTTGSFDSTGATLLVLTYTSLSTNIFPTTGTIVTDSAGNTWTYAVSNSAQSGTQSGIWYTTGPSGTPTVLNTSTTHTVTLTPAGSGSYNFSFQVLAFTGTIPSSGFLNGTYSNSTTANTTLSCSNITPTATNCLVVSVFGEDATAGSGSFTGGAARNASLLATTYSQRQTVISSGSSYPNNMTFYLTERSIASSATSATWTGSLVASTATATFLLGPTPFSLTLNDTPHLNRWDN